jgi:serine/threonine-protein kinase SRPK3
MGVVRHDVASQGPPVRFPSLLSLLPNGLLITAGDGYRDDAYRALKILNHYGTLLEAGEVDDPRRPRFFEREILARVSASDVAPGAKYCMKLLESFHIERETGKHLCLVMELGGMSVEDMRPLIGTNYSMPTAFVKTIVKQMCKALDYLHEECRVVHTGLCKHH